MTEQKTNEDNKNATITNLYALYGKKCVETDAAKNIIAMLQIEVEKLNKHIKDLEDGDTGSD